MIFKKLSCIIPLVISAFAVSGCGGQQEDFSRISIDKRIFLRVGAYGEEQKSAVEALVKSYRESLDYELVVTVEDLQADGGQQNFDLIVSMDEGNASRFVKSGECAPVPSYYLRKIQEAGQGKLIDAYRDGDSMNVFPTFVYPESTFHYDSTTLTAQEASSWESILAKSGSKKVYFPYQSMPENFGIFVREGLFSKVEYDNEMRIVKINERMSEAGLDLAKALRGFAQSCESNPEAFSSANCLACVAPRFATPSELESSPFVRAKLPSLQVSGKATAMPNAFGRVGIGVRKEEDPMKAQAMFDLAYELSSQKAQKAIMESESVLRYIPTNSSLLAENPNKEYALSCFDSTFSLSRLPASLIERISVFMMGLLDSDKEMSDQDIQSLLDSFHADCQALIGSAY